MTLFSAILLLTGCIEGSAWPSRGNAQLTTFADTGQTTTTVTTPSIPCSGPPEGTSANLTLSNPTYQIYRISVMDPYCEEQFFLEVFGSSAWQGFVGNHQTFVVREADDTYVRWFQVPSGSGVVWTETLP